MRTTILALIAMVAAGCSPAPAVTPTAGAWTDRVLTPAPEAVAAQPIVTHGPDSITLLPISPIGAVVGVTYGFDMGHCGISSEIDVDGSFWDAVGVPQDSVDFDGWPGTFRLTSRNDATFTTTGGAALRLVRHAGAKEFRLCS